MGDSQNVALDAVIEAGKLKDWLNTINALVDEHRHHMTSVGFRASAIDPSSAAMVHTTLGANAFRHYEAGSDLVGMPTEGVIDALSRAKSDDMVHLTITDHARLQIDYGSVSISRALIDPDVIRKDPDTPNHNFAGTVEIATDDLQTAAWTASMVDEKVDINFDPQSGVTFRASGDTDESAFELGLDELGDGSTIATAATSMYSVNFFELMVNALPDGTVEFSIGDEFPLEMGAELNDSGRVVFILAPRINK